MGADDDMSDRQQVAVLSDHIRELEAELGTARATLTALQSRLLVSHAGGGLGEAAGGCPSGNAGEAGNPAVSPGIVPTALPMPFNALPLSEGTLAAQLPSSPFILLEPLPMHDALRRKWRLGSGLPSPDGSMAGPVTGVADVAAMRMDGHLRLFGLLPDGQPWEKILPFAELSREGGLTIGRDADSCDIVLPETSVSRCHARLELGRQGLSITDLGSTNGLFVNDERYAPYCPCAPLVDGMTLGLGETILRVEIIQTS